jgi:hypothetical protein
MFSARDFGFQRQDLSFSSAVSAISAVICHFLTALLIDQGFNSIQYKVECAAVQPGLAFCCSETVTMLANFLTKDIGYSISISFFLP